MKEYTTFPKFEHYRRLTVSFLETYPGHSLRELCNILALDRAGNYEMHRCKQQVHHAKDIRVSAWPVEVLNSVQLRRPPEAGWRQKLYNPVPQTVWISWSQLQWEFTLQFEAMRTSSRQRACGPQWPPVEQPSRMRKKSCYSQRNLGSICCRLLRLQLTSHTQPFRNSFATLSRIKREMYIFLKKCVRSSLCWLCFRIYV